MVYSQADIRIMACTMGTFASLHTYKGTFASLHITKRTFASWHALRVYLHHDIPTRGHLHHGIPIRGHLHHDIPTRSICIMTYPLEGICTTGFLHLHLCKETFASQLTMCAGTIMDKLCFPTPAWDICIMKITSLKGDMCIIWTFCIYILVKSICIENEKSRLA